MAKAKQQFLCAECGDVFPKWVGKCPSCGTFDSVKEYRERGIGNKEKGTVEGMDLMNREGGNEKREVSDFERMETGIGELDRVLGGGFFPGSLILFGGHPGIGKSTLALQIFLRLQNAMYFSGEESREQVSSRAGRLGAEERRSEGAEENASQLRNSPASHLNRIFGTNSLEDIVATIEKHKPEFVIIDSIQMVGSSTSNFGTISQIRENAETLLKVAKNLGVTVLVIGHVTKNDELAGPKVLEHIVDAVLYLEGDRNTELRILRSPKNRYGSTLEVGVFEMTGSGLQELLNPSEFFLAERAPDSSGSAITVVREGARNFLMEIQTLTVKTNFGQPRRTSHGMDLSKFHLLLAVISKFTPFPCHEYDAYLNVIGGLKVTDPASDLAICAAILSSRAEKEIPADTVIFGEVGLSGEVRKVPQMDRRIAEAEKLGFKKVVCPRIGGNIEDHLVEVVEVKNILDLLKAIF